jgi:hypothetical protein
MKKILIISAAILLIACANSNNVVRLKDVSFCQEINHQTALRGNKINCRLLWCEHDIVDEVALEKMNPLDESSNANNAVKQRTGGVTTLWCIPNDALPEGEDLTEEKKKNLKLKSNNPAGPIKFEMENGRAYQSMPNIFQRKSRKNMSSIDDAIETEYKTLPLVLKMSNK